MAHDHHSHCVPRSAASENLARIACTLGLTLLYMFAEAVGGWWSGSLALVADAGHMFSDAAALGLSLFAIWIARRPASPRWSYGYYRAEILAALANGATLAAIAALVFIEAANRFVEPHKVEGPIMLAIACGGLVVNLAGLTLLNRGRHESLNIHGAWLHLLTDALGSVAAIAAGVLIWAYGWQWIDPLASIVIGLLVIYSAWGLLQETTAILMESVPSQIDIDAVRDAIHSVEGVTGLHDLHVWTISSGLVSLSAHVELLADRQPQAALDALHKRLHDQFGIEHLTIQIEQGRGGDCQTKFS